MMTTLHPLAQAYVDRLATAAFALPPERSGELVADITEHLSLALPPGASTAEAQSVLSRLGAPEDLVADAASNLPAAAPMGSASAGAPQPPGGRAATADGSGSRQEWVAIALLLAWPLLMVLPPLGMIAWAVAVGLLFWSRRWTLTDKVLGFIASLLPVGAAIAGLDAWTVASCVPGVPEQACADTQAFQVGPLAIVLLLAWTALGIYAVIRLVRRLR